MNLLTLQGNLAENAFFCGGPDNQVVKLAVITNESYRDSASGEIKSKSIRHPVTVFGWKAKQIAENSNFFGKGALVQIKAKMVTEKSHKYEGVFEYCAHVDNTPATSVDALIRFGKKTPEYRSAGQERPQQRVPAQGQRSDGHYQPKSSSVPTSSEPQYCGGNQYEQEF